MHLKKKEKKNLPDRRGFEPGSSGREADALPRSYRCFDVELLKIKDLIQGVPASFGRPNWAQQP